MRPLSVPGSVAVRRLLAAVESHAAVLASLGAACFVLGGFEAQTEESLAWSVALGLWMVLQVGCLIRLKLGKALPEWALLLLLAWSGATAALSCVWLMTMPSFVAHHGLHWRTPPPIHVFGGEIHPHSLRPIDIAVALVLFVSQAASTSVFSKALSRHPR
jgi:hypothetical protein